jgi:nitrogen-specific signal transduction histidine kinase/CheY-like chemotaxis protein
VDSSPIAEAGENESFRTALTDITGRKRIEDDLRVTLATLEEAQDQLVRQERLRAVGQLASGAAHDLNNALSPVLGYASLLLEDPSLSAMAREWVTLARDAAADAAAVVGCLYEFADERKTEQHKKSVDLLSLMERIPEMTLPKLHEKAQQTGREITVETDLRRVPAVAGVEAELRQVLTNLVFNAVDALPEGGRIMLRSFTSKGSACLEVADNGVGMTEEERRLCFEPFFSGKTRGNGLELSVCYGIVKRHLGDLEVESLPEGGTVFRLTLPPFEAAFDPVISEDPGSAPLPKGHILYIDDDARVRPLLKALLEHLGQTVALADGGAAGLELIETSKFDAVITDMGMPDVDGLQVVRLVRERHPELPVVMLTGWPESIALENVADEFRPTAFLQKPASIPMLRAALSRVLRRPA